MIMKTVVNTVPDDFFEDNESSLDKRNYFTILELSTS